MQRHKRQGGYGQPQHADVGRTLEQPRGRERAQKGALLRSELLDDRFGVARHAQVYLEAVVVGFRAQVFALLQKEEVQHARTQNRARFARRQGDKGTAGRALYLRYERCYKRRLICGKQAAARHQIR